MYFFKIHAANLRVDSELKLKTHDCKTNVSTFFACSQIYPTLFFYVTSFLLQNTFHQFF